MVKYYKYGDSVYVKDTQEVGIVIDVGFGTSKVAFSETNPRWYNNNEIEIKESRQFVRKYNITDADIDFIINKDLRTNPDYTIVSITSLNDLEVVVLYQKRD